MGKRGHKTHFQTVGCKSASATY